VTADWDYFYATEETVRICADLFFRHGMDSGVISLEQASTAQQITLVIALPGLADHQDDLRAIALGRHSIPLGLPPADLYG
jgi:hypothetical protein